MGLFSGLGDRLNHIFSKMKNKGALTELEVKNAMREIKIALLEADVNVLIVKDVIARISEKAVGEQVLKSVTPGQQIVKIVYDELTELMGKENVKLNPPQNNSRMQVVLMCGLQGAGKTTMCGKLGAMLKGQQKKVMLVADDIYRPAAIEQLKVVGGKAGVYVYSDGKNDPVKIAKDAIKMAEKELYNVVIIDTAGRLQINEELMVELENIKKVVNPSDILLTVDAMTGQEAANVSKTFNDRLDITGVVLTKLDGDTRGGAALTIREITGKPIKFCGVGEKLNDIEPFHPDRIASRILNMGDVLTLVEKAQNAFSEEEAKKLEEKFRKNSFTLEDYLVQMDQIKKMGNLGDIINMIPGMGNKLKGANLNVNDKDLARVKAVIQSMTPRERTDPSVIKASHKIRIAKGAGVQVSDVNRLLNQFEQTKDMMKKMKNNKFSKFPF